MEVKKMETKTELILHPPANSLGQQAPRRLRTVAKMTERVQLFKRRAS